ncbi:MAG: TfoX/Sxy family protein [Granulosicoccus sp.]|nr:TfoX/Sxy family protein [Granulosicoccus sp.]
MAYDEELTARYRKALGRRKGLSDKRMMGGVCFMLNGNMIGGADRHKDTQQGRFMFRVGKDNEDVALARKGASIMEQGGRRMTGMVFVDAESCTDQELKEWVGLALDWVKTLPPK